MNTLKFIGGEAGFAYKGWSITIYRRRSGNKLDGYQYLYAYQAAKCERQPDGNGFVVTKRINGNGGKSQAIKAISL